MIENATQKDPRTYAIIGAAMEFYRQLGCGFLEPVYQQALAVEFELREIPFYREDRIPIRYKGRLLESHYSPDFICFESIVVELKALARLSGTEEAQVINYLKATGCKIGLLLNFGNRSLEHRRFVFSKSVKSV